MNSNSSKKIVHYSTLIYHLGAVLAEELDASVLSVSRIRLRCRRVFLMLLGWLFHRKKKIGSINGGMFQMLAVLLFSGH